MTAQPERYMRVKQVLELVPVSRATWWRWTKSGKAPAPIRLGAGTTVWRYADIIEFCEQQAGGEDHD